MTARELGSAPPSTKEAAVTDLRECVRAAIDAELRRQGEDAYWRNGIYDGRLDLNDLVDAILKIFP